MRRTRQLHLWIGLICSIFILIESVTGLLLSERWLLGSESMEMRAPQAITQTVPGGQDGVQSGQAARDAGQTVPSRNADTDAAGASGNNNRQAFKGGEKGAGSSVMGIIKGLHEGRIGQTNVKWLADLTAVAMIFLTLTGITLSIKSLRAQSIRRKKRHAEA